MGRVHKKKYQKDAENAEMDDQSVASGKDDSGQENPLGPVDGEKSGDESGEEDLPLMNTSINSGLEAKKNSSENEAEEYSEHEDDSDVAGGEESGSEEEKPLVNKTATKRKASSKKAKNGENDEDGEEEEECDPLAKNNGVSPPKKSKSKGAKKTGSKRGRKPKVVAAKNDEENDENEEDEDGEEYEVKEVIDHKVKKGVNYYLIRWKGYTKDDDTWEAEDTLSCQDLIDKFHKKQNNSSPSDKKKGKPKKQASSGAAKKRKEKSEDPEKEWEVDKIIDFAKEKQGRVFRIRWKGFGPKFDTWEPESNLSCSDLIEKFMKKIDSQKDVSFKHLRKAPKKTKRLVNETSVLPREHNARKSKRGAGKKRMTYADSDE